MNTRAALTTAVLAAAAGVTGIGARRERLPVRGARAAKSRRAPGFDATARRKRNKAAKQARSRNRRRGGAR